MRIKLFIPAIFISVSACFAQQDMQQLSSYMFNQLVYNPAAGGMYESDFNFNTTTKIQWAGVPGAPVTNYSWADYRFSKNSMAIGANFMYEKRGASSFTDFALNYSYILRLSNTLKFSMGLRAGFTSATFDPSAISKIDNTDDHLTSAISTTYPKFGLGFQLYNRQFYLGLGMPDLAPLNNTYGNDKNKPFFQKNRNFILAGGYRIKLSDAFGLYPNAKINYSPNLPVFVDVSTLLEITDYFWAGANYSSRGVAALMAGTFISSRVRLMYAYEFPIKSQVSTLLAAHEISIMLQLDELFAKRKKAAIEEGQ